MTACTSCSDGTCILCRPAGPCQWPWCEATETVRLVGYRGDGSVGSTWRYCQAHAERLEGVDTLGARFVIESEPEPVVVEKSRRATRRAA
jgi:hypothetical protein